MDRKLQQFDNLINKNVLILCSAIEVKSYNRLETRDTYNVIGMIKGDIEPGTFEHGLCLAKNFLLYCRSIYCRR